MVINGTTRESGNTDTLLSRLIEGAREAGGEVEHAILRDLSIANCIGCCRCLREKMCNFPDDMTWIRRSMMAADICVFASPIYWCEVTGLMKTFVDRLYFFHHKDNRPMIAGKKALVLTTLGEAKVEYESAVLVEFYKRFLDSLGFDILDMLFFGDLMDKDAVHGRSDYLDTAHAAGRRLAHTDHP